MADRVIENYSTEIPEMDETLKQLMATALDEGKTYLETVGDITPFTMMVVGDKLLTEMHPGDTTEMCYAAAQHAVEGARGAVAYAFCYDGYLDTDDGTKDAIICEGGVPGEPDGFAIGLVYHGSGDDLAFEAKPNYIGHAPNFMAGITGLVSADNPFDYSEAGEELEYENAVDFGEPVGNPPIDTIADGEKLEHDNAADFGEPIK